MSEVAVFGRYRPGASPLHRMDPRAKLLFSLAFMAIVFCAQTFWGLALCAVFTVGLFLLAGIPLGAGLRSIGPLAFMIVITVILNIFFVQGGEVYFQWWIIQISAEGVQSAAFIGVRLLMLLLGMSLLTLTTTTLDITEAFERLLGPLVRIGVPAHELGMMMGIALRFLPQFVFELKTIYRAQISRGATITVNPFKGGLSLIGSLVIPLFTSAFRHAETLSAAMEARCYHGGSGRTRLHPLVFSSLDRTAALVFAGLFILVLASNFIPH